MKMNMMCAFMLTVELIVVQICCRMSTGTRDVPLSHSTLGSHGTFHQSQVWDTYMYLVPLVHHPIVPWYLGIPGNIPNSPWDRTSARASARSGTAGISHVIPRHNGTIGWDGQERLSIFQTWDWWDVPWDSNAPWDNGTSQDILRSQTTLVHLVLIPTT